MNLESFGLCSSVASAAVLSPSKLTSMRQLLLCWLWNCHPRRLRVLLSLVPLSPSLTTELTCDKLSCALCALCAGVWCCCCVLTESTVSSLSSFGVATHLPCTRLWCTQLCLGFTCSKWIEKQWLLLFTRQYLLVIIAAAAAAAAALIATGGAQFRSVLFCVVCFVSAITCWLEMSPTTTTTPIDWLFNYQCPSLLFLSCTSFLSSINLNSERLLL